MSIMPIYDVTAKAGGISVTYTDIDAAAKAFHETDANDQPSVIRSVGNSASIIAATVKYGDSPRSKSVGNADSVFKHAYESIADVLPRFTEPAKGSTYSNVPIRPAGRVLDFLSGLQKAETSLVPVVEMSAELQAEIAALERVGSTEGQFSIEAAAILHENDDDIDMRTEKLGKATVIYEVNHSKKTIHIASLRVPQTQRGQGAAKAALQSVVDGADAIGYAVTLDASPLDRRTSLSKLVGLCRQFGFEVTGRTINPMGDPEMVRPARGAVNDKTSRAAFAREAVAPVFYSALARAIETVMPRNSNGLIDTAQAIAWIDSKAREGRLFKAAEVEWSGIRDYLDGFTGKVPVDDLVRFVDEDGIKVMEVIKGGPTEQQQRNTQSDKVGEIARRLFGQMRTQGARLEIAGQMYFDDELAYALIDGDVLPADLPEELQAAAREWVVEYPKHQNFSPVTFGNTKYQEYVLSGGEYYRELLLTLPGKKAKIEFTPLHALPDGYGVSFDRSQPEGDQYSVIPPDQAHGAPYGGWRAATAEEAKAGALQILNSELDNGARDKAREMAKQAQYHSTHWDEANILAHIRFNDRVDADGNKVLFVEELQSDWAQQGKKQGFGYKDSTPLNEQENKELDLLYDLRGQRTDEQTARMHALNNRLNASSGKAGIPTAPFVTDTKTWLSLGIKRMIRFAAENGYEKIAFINGQQSADRYDLSKVVETVRLAKLDSGKVSVFIERKGSNGRNAERATPRGGVDTDQIENYIGKDAAEKGLALLAVDVPAQGMLPSATLAGLDLKIGGEGMKTFYDKIVPQVVNDVLKKLGGSKVQPLQLDGIASYEQLKAVGKATGLSDAQLDAMPVSDRKRLVDAQLSGQLGFDITPAMREMVMDGLPMFARENGKLDTLPVAGVMESVTQSPAFQNWFNGSKIVGADGNALKVYHGTGADMGSVMHPHTYFAVRPDVADIYATAPTRQTADAGPNVTPVYLSIKNPYVFDATLINDNISHHVLGKRGSIKEVAGKLKADGFDGMIIRNYLDLGGVQDQYVAFDSHQIKSSIGNNGEFDPDNADIRFRRDEDVADAVVATLPATEALDFSRWFGESKVVDAVGKPLVVYHGTRVTDGIESFYPDSHFGTLTPANTKAMNGPSVRGAVYPVFLKIENPKRVVDQGTIGRGDWDDAIEKAKAEGYDGLVYKNTAEGEGTDSYVSFNPKQIKSATGNNGDFDPDNADIRFRSEVINTKYAFDNWFGDSKIVAPDGAPLVVYHGTDASFDKFQSHAKQQVSRLDDVEITTANSWDMGDDSQGNPDWYHYGALSDALHLGPAVALRIREAEAKRMPLIGADTERVLRDLRRLQAGKFTRSGEIRPTGDGFYFTTDLQYSYVRDADRNTGGNVMPVYLSIKNPVYLNASQIESAGAEFNVEKYKAQGYDGAIFADNTQDLTKRGWNGAVQIVAFDAKQVKSAIGNNGDYDASNPDIRFFRTPEIKRELKLNPSIDVEKDAVKALAKAFGTRTGMLRLAKGGKFRFSGLHHKGTIWLSEEATKPLHTVFGHELLHAMKQERPDLYRGLCVSLEPLLVNEERYKQTMGLQHHSKAYIREEMIADLVGDRFAEQSFWTMVRRNSGDLFKGIADFVSDKIALARKAVVGTARNRTLGSDAFVAELDKAREVIAVTVADYLTAKNATQHPGFFEKLQGSTEHWLAPTPEPPLHWVATLLAENIDNGINTIYEAATGKNPVYQEVFDWLLNDAFNQKNKTYAAHDLMKIAKKRGHVSTAWPLGAKTVLGHTTQFNGATPPPNYGARFKAGEGERIEPT